MLTVKVDYMQANETTTSGSNSTKTVLAKGQRTCPKCNSNWDGGSILETFIKQREDGVECWRRMSNEQIEEEVKKSYSPPYRWGREIGIELPYDHQKHYDGISAWECPDCKTTFNAFTGVEESCY